VLGCALGILVLQGAWLAVPEARRATVVRVALPVAVLVLLVISVVETVDAIDAGTPYAKGQRRDRTLTRGVIGSLPPGDGPVLINTSRGGIMAPAIALALERRGIPVEVNPSQPVVYGDHRSSHDDTRYRAELTVVLGDRAIREFDPPGPRVAYFVRAHNETDRAAIEGFLRQARDVPPGPEREALVRAARDAGDGPAEEIAVYLTERGR
jgi:hypothetical protein